jgi:3',5'-nucleoside bisphosphate phosphatase
VKTCLADTHVHTALSPCADDGMTPAAIVARALDKGLDMIAICDHNSARNVAAVQAAAGDRLSVLAGMEITSAEECHVVGLFPTAVAAEAVGEELAAMLPAITDGYELFFGEQHVLAADGTEIDRETRALATATPLALDAVVALVHAHDGVAVAAHIDRPSFGVIGQLGFFPVEAGFDGVELSRHAPPRGAGEFAKYGLPIVRASDAHYLDDIGVAHTTLRCEQPGFAEVVLALAARQGRSIGDA